MYDLSIENRNKIEKELKDILLSIKLINPHDVIITGGCIESLLLGEIPNDYDIYFTSFEELNKIYQTMYKKFGTKMIPFVKTKTDGIRFCDNKMSFTEQEVTFTHCSVSFEKNGKKIQLVTRTSGDIEKIHDEFDYFHCMHYFSLEKGLVLNPCVSKNKELIVNPNFHVSFDSVKRLVKFIQRGYSISEENLKKFYCRLTQAFIDLSNINEDLFY